MKDSLEQCLVVKKCFLARECTSWLSNQFGQKPKMKNCKFLAGHLVMSMRQGWGGDLCNRGDPPSNMTAHRYQPSPNIKWTRLPFSHEHKSFPKPSPPSLCVCQNAPVGFREAEERQFVRARGPPHFTDTGQGAPPETDGRPLHSTPWHGPPSEKPQSGSMVVESKRFSHKQFMPKPVLSLFWQCF